MQRPFFSVPLCLCGSLLLVAVASAAPSSALADAVEKKDAAAIRALITDTNINAAQVDGMTALHWAVYHDDADTAKRLLAAGADVKAQNRYGVTPLSLACTNGSAALVDLLLAAGADANAPLRGGETPLMTAARTGKLGPVKALLAHGADVNAKRPSAQTALMWAAAEGHLELAYPVGERKFALGAGRGRDLEHVVEHGRERRVRVALLLRPGGPARQLGDADFLSHLEGRLGEALRAPLFGEDAVERFETRGEVLEHGILPRLAFPVGEAFAHAGPGRAGSEVAELTLREL